jgi:hypothetical protein
MISSNCDIYEFIDAIDNCDYQELIVVASQEAVEAERIGLHSENKAQSMENPWKNYANQLKELIFLVRHGSRPKRLMDQFENSLGEHIWRNDF